MKTRRGFTLIELLVVIAIIALLLAVLVPSLAMAKHYALRVMCMNNARQSGLAVSMYANAFDNDVVPNYTISSATIADPPTHIPAPFNSYMVYHPNQTRGGGFRPFHLAVFYELDYISEPKVFYCPGQPKSASHYVIPYYHEFYVGEGVSSDYSGGAMPGGDKRWNMLLPADRRGSGSRLCRTSYNYWTYGQRKLSKIRTFQPIIVDNIQDWRVVPHRKGRDIGSQPQGLTAVYPDGHASFCSDPEIFRDDNAWPWNRLISVNAPPEDVGQGPGNTLSNFEEILRRMQGK